MKRLTRNLIANSIDAYVLAERGKLEFRSTTALKGRCRFWETARLDVRGTPALVGLTANSDTLVIARRRGAAAFDEKHIPLDSRPQRLLLADMDNDRQNEILLFGSFRHYLILDRVLVVCIVRIAHRKDVYRGL